MMLRNDMCHTAEKCPDPIILMPSHTAMYVYYIYYMNTLPLIFNSH